MIFRLVSAMGAVAHIGDALLNRLPAARLQRRSIATPIAVVVLVCAAVAGIFGLQALNQSRHTYGVADLVADTAAGPGEMVAVNGTVSHFYSKVTSGGKIAYYTYFLIDGSGKYAIMVRSMTDPSEMYGDYPTDSAFQTQFSGILRDPTVIQRGLNTAMLGDVAVSRGFVLMEGDVPASPQPFFWFAGLAALFGLMSLVGARTGFVVFRPGRAEAVAYALPERGTPVRVTGLLSVHEYTLRAREMRASIAAAVPGGAARAFGSWPAVPIDLPGRPVDLVWDSKGAGLMRLTPGGVTEAIPGTAYPFGGERPAIMVRSGRQKLLLSFDEQVARNMVFAQLRTAGGLAETADGRLVSPVTTPEPAAEPAPEPVAEPAPEPAPPQDAGR